MPLCWVRPRRFGPGKFHGWRIVGAGIIAQALGVGLIGAFGFFVTPLAAEFQASNAQIGLGMSLFGLTSGLLSPVLGPALDRGRVRTFMLGGVALMGAGCLGMASATSLAELSVFLVATFAGVVLYGPLPVHVLIVHWFRDRRGRALSLAALGVSLPGFFVPPLAAWLIDAFGWRNALIALGLGSAAIVAPVIAATVVCRPEDIGQLPDGRQRGAELPGALPIAQAPHTNTAQLLGDRDFWLIALAFALVLGAPLLNGVFLVRHLEHAGISRQAAGFILSWMAAFGVVGKLVAAALTDRLDKRWLAWSLIAIQLVSWTLLLERPSTATVLAAAAGLGLGVGGFMPLPALFVGAWFGLGVFGRAAGLMGPLRLPVTLSVVPVGGWLADRTESYGATFALAMAIAAVGAFLLVFLRPPRKLETPSA